MIKEGLQTVNFVKNLNDIKSDDPKVQQKAKNYIFNLCKENGGLFTKIIQFVGNKAESEDQIENWQNEIGTVLDRKTVLEILEKEWGKDPFEHLSEVSDEFFSASIGQVVKATHKNGELIAIKTQYPKIEESIKQQLKLIGLLPKAGKISKVRKWGVDFSSYQKMIENLLYEELNYHHEKTKQIEFYKFFESDPDLAVPKVYDDLCTKKVFVSEFVEGISFLDICKLDKEIKLNTANRLMNSFLKSLFYKHEIHCDPNPYNFIFKIDKLYLIDFGQTFSYSEEFINALRQIYICLRDKRDMPALELFCALGFERSKLIHFEDVLPFVAEILLRPFLSRFAFDLNDWNYQKHLKLLLGESIWWFRSAGGTEFFSLMKTFAGLKEMVIKLKVNVFYHRLIEEIINDSRINWNELEYITSVNSHKVQVNAKKIFIQVIKEGKEKVKLSFPSTTILELPEMLDKEIKERLEKRGLDISEIIRNCIKSGVSAGTLFELSEESDHFKVWLE